MDYAMMYPGRFFKAGDLNGKDLTLTIKSVRVEELEQDKGGVRGKGIVSFVEDKREWVLNKTNGECLKALWGRETDRWLGKRVTLFPAPHFDSFTKENSIAIRVRGSPDLDAPKSVIIKLRKKKDTTMTLVKTGAGVAAPAAVPTITFGPHRGVALASATDAQLKESRAMGEANVAAEPGAQWVPGVTACLAIIAAEQAVRAEKPAPAPAEGAPF